jgi:hypothetical protein
MPGTARFDPGITLHRAISQPKFDLWPDKRRVCKISSSQLIKNFRTWPNCFDLPDKESSRKETVILEHCDST